MKWDHPQLLIPGVLQWTPARCYCWQQPGPVSELPLLPCAHQQLRAAALTHTGRSALRSQLSHPHLPPGTHFCHTLGYIFLQHPQPPLTWQPAACSSCWPSHCGPCAAGSGTQPQPWRGTPSHTRSRSHEQGAQLHLRQAEGRACYRCVTAYLLLGDQEN